MLTRIQTYNDRPYVVSYIRVCEMCIYIHDYNVHILSLKMISINCLQLYERELLFLIIIVIFVLDDMPSFRFHKIFSTNKAELF